MVDGELTTHNLCIYQMTNNDYVAIVIPSVSYGWNLRKKLICMIFVMVVIVVGVVML